MRNYVLLPETFDVTATRQHAEAGMPDQTDCCALALSIRDRFRIDTGVKVNPTSMRIEDEGIDLPPKTLVLTLPDGSRAHYGMPQNACDYALDYDNRCDRLAIDDYEKTHLPEDWPEAVTFTFTRTDG